MNTKSLIDMVKTFTTKPVGRKHQKKPSTADQNEALDVLHDVTIDKLSTLHVETDGSSRPSAIDTSVTKSRKIKCKMCTDTYGTVKELNAHHKKDHGVVQCKVCSKYFSTQSSLDKHSYSHKELKVQL